MKHASVLALALLAGTLLAAEGKPAPEKFSLKMNFDSPIQRGYGTPYKSKIFIAPTKGLQITTDKKNVRTGTGALQLLKKGDSLTLDMYLLKPGKVYTFTLYVHSAKPGTFVNAGFLWFKGNKCFRADNKTLEAGTTGEWTKITRTVKAPEGFTHNYFWIQYSKGTAEAFADDLVITEE